MLQLENLLDRSVSAVKTGERNCHHTKCGFGLQWFYKPSIILADEPTGNLDSKTSDDVIGLLKMTSEEFRQTIVMITHNPEIAQMADRIVRIEDGRIVA